MFKKLCSLFGVALLMLALPIAASAQATLTQTTLATAVTDTSGTFFVVTSATGFVKDTTVAYIDNEMVSVNSVSGTLIGVTRGYSGTLATTHATSAALYVGPPSYFTTTNRYGSCTSTNELVLPLVNVNNGNVFNCVSSLWQITAGPLTVITGVSAIGPNAAGTVDIGSSALSFRDLFLAGSSGTPATNRFRITGSTAAPRTITIPDPGGAATLATTNPTTAQAITNTTISGNTFTTGSSTYTGTAAQTYTFPTTSATLARIDAGNTWTGAQVYSAGLSGITTLGMTGILTNTATTNQFLLGGAAHTATVNFPAPAGANTTYTVPDSVAASNIITSPPPISAVGPTLALTTAQCGQLVQFGATTGEVVTLPNPAGFVGCWYDFVITVSNTSNFNEIRTDGASRFLLGAVEHSATGIAPLTFWANGTTIQAIKMDGINLGGLIGSYFHVLAISATQWEITGRNECVTVCTTAFNATP